MGQRGEIIGDRLRKAFPPAAGVAREGDRLWAHPSPDKGVDTLLRAMAGVEARGAAAAAHHRRLGSAGGKAARAGRRAGPGGAGHFCRSVDGGAAGAAAECAPHHGRAVAVGGAVWDCRAGGNRLQWARWRVRLAEGCPRTGPCGLSFPNGDSTALAAGGLRRLLTEEGLIAQLRVGAAATARHTGRAVAEQYLCVFADCLLLSCSRIPQD